MSLLAKFVDVYDFWFAARFALEIGMFEAAGWGLMIKVLDYGEARRGW